jgi:preprotein translocase subunit YajC
MNLLSIALLEDTPPAAQGAQGIMGTLVSLAPFILCIAVFWFIVLRPEQKTRKARAAMLGRLGKGDKIMTTGGMYGQVVQIQDDIVTLQVADGVRMRFARSAIQTVEAESSDKAVEAKANNA